MKIQPMFAEQRQQEILDRVRRDGMVSVDDLVERFGVSAPTIRADLGVLHDRRLLRRTHGGAMSVETTLHEPPFAERERAHQTEKARIASAAAALVQDHETVLLDAGTTTFEIAKQLMNRVGLTVVTNSLEAAWTLMRADSGQIETIIIGGTVHARRRAALGPLATRFLDGMRVDRAFIGVNGVHPVNGWTVTDFDAAQVKRAMMACAREVVVVADHSKIGEATFASIGPLSLANLLITDSTVTAPLKEALDEAGVETIVAP